MAGRWAVGSIAGVALTDSGSRNMRVDVVDGEELKSVYVGSSVQALDFSVHTQLSNHGTKGVRFGCHIAMLAISKLNSIVTAIEAAAAGNTPFNVTLADALSSPASLDNLNVSCVIDYQQTNGKLFQRGALSNVYVKDVVFRFISVS
jgi:hypothetical protein